MIRAASRLYSLLCPSLSPHLALTSEVHDGEGALKTHLLGIKKEVRGYDSSKLAFSSPELYSRLPLHAEQFELCCNCLCCFSFLVIFTMEFDLITFARGRILSHSLW